MKESKDQDVNIVSQNDQLKIMNEIQSIKQNLEGMVNSNNS